MPDSSHTPQAREVLPQATHRVEWDVVSESPTFLCDRQPDDPIPACRVICTEDCEQWGAPYRDARGLAHGGEGIWEDYFERHDMREYDCNVVQWLHAIDAEDGYSGSLDPDTHELPRRDGVIDVEWDDGYLWRYAERPQGADA